MNKEKNEEKISSEQSFEELLNEKFPEVSKNKRTLLEPGMEVYGEVIKVEDKKIYLNINAQTEGEMYLNYYTKDESVETFKGLVKKGQIVHALISSIQDEPYKTILLSRIPLIEEKTKQQLLEIVQGQKTVSVKIKEMNKGGLVSIYLGYEIFIPFSNLDYEIVEHKEDYVGKNLEIIIQEASFNNKRKPKIIGTRRPIFEAIRQQQIEEERSKAQAELDTIKTGDVLNGTVYSIKPHGAIIKFEAQKGILRISQISHYRIQSVDSVLKVGDTVRVKVIKKEDNKLDLSIKALELTPFQNFITKHKNGDVLEGTISQKMPFGFFVELEKEVKGLLHRTEFSWDPKDNFGTQSKIGDKVLVKIIKIEVEKEQISLSRKALIDNPWANVELEKNSNVEAIIEQFEEQRVLVSCCGVNAYIKNDEMDIKKGKPADFYNIGEKINAKVKYFNKNGWILELSVKRYNAEVLINDYEKAVAEEILEQQQKPKTSKVAQSLKKDK